MPDSPIFTKIEDIILQYDIRGMKALRQHMKDGWLEASAQLLLNHPGKVFIKRVGLVAGTGSRKRPDTRQAVGHGSSGPPPLIPGRLAEAQERGTMIHVQR